MSRRADLDPRLARMAQMGSLLALCALLFLVDLFLPWHQLCFGPISPFDPGPVIGGSGLHFLPDHTLAVSCSYSGSGWGGAGITAAILAGLLLLWEAARVARADVHLGPAYRSLVAAALSLGVLLFGAINVLGQLTWLAPTGTALLYGGTFLWISLALALLIGFLGLVHWRIWEAQAPSPPGAARAPAPPSGPRTCGSCGRVNPADAAFCSGCGKSLSPSA